MYGVYGISGRETTEYIVYYIWSYSVYIGCTSKVKGCLQLEHSTQRDVGLFLALCTGFQKAPALEV